MISQPVKEEVPPVAFLGLAAQASVPPGLVAMAKVIELVAVVTTLPEPSSMLTAGWVAQVAPSAPPPGWVL